MADLGWQLPMSISAADHKLEKHQEEHHASSLLHRILAPFQKTPAGEAEMSS